MRNRYPFLTHSAFHTSTTLVNIAVKHGGSSSTLKLSYCCEWHMFSVLTFCKEKMVDISFILLEGMDISLLYSKIIPKHL